MSSRGTRWGIAGTGGISHQIASDFRLVDHAQVVAVSSRRADTADAFADEYGIRQRFTSLADMVESELDAVYIGTPHVTHFELASEAIRAGKHVLCEKPLAMDASEVARLSELAAEANVFLMEAMWMKFTPLHRKLAALIAAGAIGDVRSLQASFGAAFPRDDSSRWKPGGSALLDQGIYPVTLAHMLFGAPTSIDARGTVRADGVDLRGHVTLGFDDARTAQLAFSMVDWFDYAATIGGTEAWVTIRDGFWFATELTLHRPLERGQRDDEVIEAGREGFGYVPMLRAVCDAIGEGSLEHPLHTHADVASIYRTLDAVRGLLVESSAPTGR